MFLIDSLDKKVSLHNYCDKIILDDPRVVTADQTPIYDLVKNTLENALQGSGLSYMPIEKRHTDQAIYYCQQRYCMMAVRNNDKFKKLFSKEPK